MSDLLFVFYPIKSKVHELSKFSFPCIIERKLRGLFFRHCLYSNESMNE